MNSEIDSIQSNYQSWGLDTFSYSDRLLTLSIKTFDKNDNEFRFLIIFRHAVMFQVYDEIDHFENFTKFRDVGIVAEHKESDFIEYVNKQTNVIATSPVKLKHWSVLTTNEFVHVLSNEEPFICNVS